MIRTEKQAKSRGGRSVKRKGSAYELEVMDQINVAGFQAHRTVGSGARNAGGDLVMTGQAVPHPLELECKRSKLLGANLIRQMRSCDALVFRNDRGKSHIVIDLALFLDLVK
jgi:Holliday junction resolvase